MARQAEFREQPSGGFTLVELLVVVSILLILGSLSLSAFSLYKEQARVRSSEELMRNARLALEAGKGDNESFPAAMIIVDQNAPGVIADATGKALMPGLVLPDHFRLFATHDPTCAADACMEDFIQARHCQTSKKTVYFRTFGGIEATMYNVADPAPCS